MEEIACGRHGDGAKWFQACRYKRRRSRCGSRGWGGWDQQAARRVPCTTIPSLCPMPPWPCHQNFQFGSPGVHQGAVFLPRHKTEENQRAQEKTASAARSSKLLISADLLQGFPAMLAKLLPREPSGVCCLQRLFSQCSLKLSLGMLLSQGPEGTSVLGPVTPRLAGGWIPQCDIPRAVMGLIGDPTTQHVPAALFVLWSRVGMPYVSPNFMLVFLSHVICPASTQLQKPFSKEQLLKFSVGGARAVTHRWGPSAAQAGRPHGCLCCFPMTKPAG